MSYGLSLGPHLNLGPLNNTTLALRIEALDSLKRNSQINISRSPKPILLKIRKLSLDSRPITRPSKSFKRSSPKPMSTTSQPTLPSSPGNSSVPHSSRPTYYTITPKCPRNSLIHSQITDNDLNYLSSLTFHIGSFFLFTLLLEHRTPSVCLVGRIEPEISQSQY